LASGLNEVSGEKIEDALKGFVEFQLGPRMRMRGVEFAIEAGEERVAGQDLVDREEAGFQAVVNVGGVVGDFVNEVDKLRFERRALVE